MIHSTIFQLVYIDVSGHTRRETSLATGEKEVALRELATSVSPHIVELWRGSELIASRRPNGPSIIVEGSSPRFLATLHRGFAGRPTALIKRLVTAGVSPQKAEVAA